MLVGFPVVAARAAHPLDAPHELGVVRLGQEDLLRVLVVVGLPVGRQGDGDRLVNVFAHAGIVDARRAGSLAGKGERRS